MRLEALENRELLAADVLTAAATGAANPASSPDSIESADFASFADETQPVDVSIPLDLAATAPAETVSSAAPEIAVANAETGTTWTVTSLLDDGTDGTLRVAIDNAAAGDTITFADSLKGGTITLNGTELKIEKSLTIDASNLCDAETQLPGITINADQKSRVFKITGGTEESPVVLKGLTITAGKTTLDDCAAGVDASGATTIRNCRFENNVGKERGALRFSGTASATIVSSQFFNNKATNGWGAAIFNGANVDLTIESSVFSGNEASNSGGAIYSNGDLTLNDVDIRSNKAKWGGGIYLSDSYQSTPVVVTIVRSSITDNTATAYGGGIDFDGDADHIGNLTLTETTLARNSAPMGGGLHLAQKAAATLTDCDVSANASTGSGGGIYASDSSVALTDCDVSANASTGSGGGIYASNSSVTLTDCAISTNTAKTYGGGVFATGGTLAATRCSISGNSSSDRGGGIRLDGGVSATLSNSLVVENFSNANGGGISANTSSALSLTLVGCTLAKNRATNYGGGVHCGAGNFTFVNTIIAENIAGTEADDLYNYERQGKISTRNVLADFASWVAARTDEGGCVDYDPSQPLFADVAAFNYSLATGSQALDKGSDADALDADGTASAFDLTGAARIVGNSVDVGAYEGFVESVGRAENRWKDDASNSNWNDASNWSLGHIPTWTETAAIGENGKVVVANGAAVGAARCLGTLTVSSGTFELLSGASSIESLSVASGAGLTVKGLDASLTANVSETLKNVSITVSNGATVALNGLRQWTGGTLTVENRAATSVPALTTFESSTASFSNVVFDAPLLANVDASRFSVSNGAKVSLNGVESYTVSSSGTYAIASASGAGSVLAFPNLKTIVGYQGDSATQETVEATNFGVVDLSGLESVVGPVSSSGWFEFVEKDGGEIVYPQTISTTGNVRFSTKDCSITGTVYNDLNRNGRRDNSLFKTDDPRVVFVVDTSGSMQCFYPGTPVGDRNGDGIDSRIDGVIFAMSQFQRRLGEMGLGETAELALVDFSGTVRTNDVDPVAEGVQYFTTANADRDGDGTNDFMRAACKLDANREDGTNFALALQQTISVLESQGETDRETVVFFLTDGAYNAGGTGALYARKLRNMGATVRTLGLGTGSDVSYEGILNLDDNGVWLEDMNDVYDVFSGLSGDFAQYSEPGLEGRVVYIDLDDDGKRDAGEPVATTDADGIYRFTGLEAGDYTLRVENLPGWRLEQPSGEIGGYALQLEEGESLRGVDFGYSASVDSVALESENCCVGTTLTANVSPEGATATYQWFRVDGGGSEYLIAGQTKATYTLSASDFGYRVKVVATGCGDYVGSASAISQTVVQTEKLTRIGTSTSQPTVGVKITTTLYVGAAKKLDSGATATYQWYRVDASGKATAISGATGSTYTPVAADVGYKLRVTATGTGNYAGTVTATHSSATKAAQQTALTRIGTSTSQPTVGVKITTTLYVGAAKKLDSGATATYQWYRVDASGKATAISGATSSSYTPVAADVGYKLRVTATGTGNYTGTVTATHSSATIAGQATETLTRIGTSTSQPAVGVKITTTLYVGAAKKLDSGATATYQWYRVDAKTKAATAISGATSSSYTPTTEDVGYKLRVTATGTGNYKGTVTATHSRATVAAKSSAVLDDAFAEFEFDWETAFAEF